MTILTALAIALALLVSAVVVVLVAPIRADVTVTVDPVAPGPRVSAQLRWLFVSWSADSGRSGSSQPRRRRRDRRRRRRPWHGGAARARAVLATPGFVARVIRLAAELLRRLRPRQLAVRARVGFDDPATTGCWYGLASAGLAMPRPAGWDLAITPEFDHAELSGNARLRWEIRPGVVLWPIVAFAGSPVTWRAGWAAFRAGRA